MLQKYVCLDDTDYCQITVRLAYIYIPALNSSHIEKDILLSSAVYTDSGNLRSSKFRLIDHSELQ
jgi:hypothetical protein